MVCSVTECEADPGSPDVDVFVRKGPGDHKKRCLHFKFTALSKTNPFPEFSAVAIFDDRRVVHYNNKSKSWVRESLTEDDWTKSPAEPPGSRDWFIHQMKTLSNCGYSECSELHIFQRIIGCELEKNSDGTVSQVVFDEYGFDGEDFIAFNSDTVQWIDKNPKATETKMYWDRQTQHNQFVLHYLQTCVHWISTFNNTKKISRISSKSSTPRSQPSLNSILMAKQIEAAAELAAKEAENATIMEEKEQREKIQLLEEKQKKELDAQKSEFERLQAIKEEIPAVTPTDVIKVLESDFKDTEQNTRVVSQEDIMFLNKLGENIRMNQDSHFEMPLPFKKRPCLPDNEPLAVMRLQHLKRRLMKDQEYREHYVKFMEDVIEKGDGEEVTDEGREGQPNVHVFMGKYDQNRQVLTCLATGFYPRDIEINIRLNKVNTENQTSSGIRPNGDGSFQMRASVEIDKDDERSYDCHVIHSSLTEPVSIKWAPPDVHVFVRKDPDDHSKLNLTCLATGFYPREALQMRTNVEIDRKQSFMTDRVL
ncbi:major histocompatibility complex class I-related gene protein-like [Labeo rohita]|uniref:Major histocompatibility complex class I-related gene protein-like n=1 Tax=Labeo rohita TaxID=84645 RepID=A0A498L947_LABRO|nr:major histocompatibility complex class I-related gene protein-like [Labeo rohita]